jgi:hypothetical protein
MVAAAAAVVVVVVSVGADGVGGNGATSGRAHERAGTEQVLDGWACEHIWRLPMYRPATLNSNAASSNGVF